MNGYDLTPGALGVHGRDLGSRRGKGMKGRRGTVIDVEEYRVELREVERLLRSRPDTRLSLLLGAPVERSSHRIDGRAVAGTRGGRIAVAAGQLLVWHYRGMTLPGPTDDPADDTPFGLAFALHWTLLRRKLQLEVRSAVDLIRLDRAGRGDTEPRHALVKLLERSFGPPAPGPLAAELRAWGDELAVDRSARFRKLATRTYRLAGDL